jgi:anti-sigma regulatory factor (Ser/Thr protein kinase)
MSAAYDMRVGADASFALSVRVFVAESARRLGCTEADVEDLRLLATELLANAIDTGQPTLWLTVSLDDDGWLLQARGTGELVVGGEGGPIDRRDVIQGLAEIRHADDGVTEFRPVVPPS